MHVYCTNTDGLVPGSWSSLLFYKAATMISNNVYSFPEHVHKFTIVNMCRDRLACALNGSAQVQSCTFRVFDMLLSCMPDKDYPTHLHN